MKLLKRPISIFIIIAIIMIDLRIIINYEVTKPTEKYSIVNHQKTVAQVLDLSNVQPKEISEETVTTETTENSVAPESAMQTIFSEESPSVTPDEEVQPEPIAEEIQPEPVEEVIPEEPIIEEIPEAEEVAISASSNEIVNTALSYVGSNYVSGGSSPSTGFDCSGFTKYIYGLYGIELNRVSGDQADNGTPISRDELQPGDLLLFSYYGSSSIGHVGIYIGDGEFVHAANSNRGVTTDTIDSGYYLDNYVGARRVN